MPSVGNFLPTRAPFLSVLSLLLWHVASGMSLLVGPLFITHDVARGQCHFLHQCSFLYPALVYDDGILCYWYDFKWPNDFWQYFQLRCVFHACWVSLLHWPSFNIDVLAWIEFWHALDGSVQVALVGGLVILRFSNSMLAKDVQLLQT